MKTDDNIIFTKYSFLVAISNNKVIDYILFKKGAVSGERFNNFVKKIVSKYKNKLILMDNAKIHSTQLVRDTIIKSGNKYLYSIPYTPKTNPIEEFFNQIKHYIKLEKPLLFDDIEKCIKLSINKIKPQHYNNYFIHAFDIKSLKKKGISTKYRKPKIYKDKIQKSNKINKKSKSLTKRMKIKVI